MQTVHGSQKELIMVRITGCARERVHVSTCVFYRHNKSSGWFN